MGNTEFRFTERDGGTLVSWNTPDSLGHALFRSCDDAEQFTEHPGNVGPAARAYLAYRTHHPEEYRAARAIHALYS